MTDKQFTFVSLAGLGLLFWYLIEHFGSVDPNTVAPADSPALPMGYQDPMLNTYNANPNAFGPATPQSITLNIANQSANLLNQRFIPLFGFVGMAQGALYQ